MIEVKKWKAKFSDEGWTAKLIGLSWQGPSHADETGSVEERWFWTPPRKDKDKDTAQGGNNQDKDKDTAQGKAKAKAKTKANAKAKTKGRN